MPRSSSGVQAIRYTTQMTAELREIEEDGRSLLLAVVFPFLLSSFFKSFICGLNYKEDRSDSLLALI